MNANSENNNEKETHNHFMGFRHNLWYVIFFDKKSSNYL